MRSLRSRDDCESVEPAVRRRHVAQAEAHGEDRPATGQARIRLEVLRAIEIRDVERRDVSVRVTASSRRARVRAIDAWPTFCGTYAGGGETMRFVPLVVNQPNVTPPQSAGATSVASATRVRSGTRFGFE